MGCLTGGGAIDCIPDERYSLLYVVVSAFSSVKYQMRQMTAGLVHLVVAGTSQCSDDGCDWLTDRVYMCRVGVN